MAKEQSKKADPVPRRRSRWVLFTIIALVVALAGLTAWYFLYESKKNESQFGSRDVNALKGRVTTLSDEEILEELNQIVDENMFNISIASQVAVYGNPQVAELRIENKDINRYLMQVDIMLDEIDEEAPQDSAEGGQTPVQSSAPTVHPTRSPEERLVYRSLIIDPGYYIPAAELRIPLEPGEYSATALFTAIYPDDETEVGKVAAKIMLFVLNQGETPEPTPMPTPTPEPTPTPTPQATDAQADPSATPLANQ